MRVLVQVEGRAERESGQTWLDCHHRHCSSSQLRLARARLEVSSTPIENLLSRSRHVLRMLGWSCVRRSCVSVSARRGYGRAYSSTAADGIDGIRVCEHSQDS
jgi:hypothetical protein